MTTRETGDNTRKAGDTKMSQRHRFDAPVPADAIKDREQSGVTLSYLDSHYIITKTNELLGHEEWSYMVDKYQLVQAEEKTSAKGKLNQYVGYVAQVTVTWNGISRTDVGFGQGIDNDLGRAHESAIKEAATDALKRALRTFGQAFGLALYDKSGAHIAEPFDPKSYQAKLGFSHTDKENLRNIYGTNVRIIEVLREAWDNNVETRDQFFDFIETKPPINGLPQDQGETN